MQVIATRKAICFSLVLRKMNYFFKGYPKPVRFMGWSGAEGETKSGKANIKALALSMKLTAIILLGACLQLSARGVSQTITLNLKNEPLQKVFKEIERQTDYTFFYELQRVEKAKKVTIIVNNLPLNQVLDLCFKDQPFTWSISGKTITVTLKKNNNTIKGAKIDKQNKSDINIRGKVLNSTGEAVSQATISVQGTTKATVTNSNGEFFLFGINEDAILVVSHVEYETAVLTLSGKSIVNITLQTKVRELDELQVIAYGTTTKRLNTGNVSTVKSADIEKQPVSNPLLALAGRVPGLIITQSSGFSGSGVKVRIQGENSISNGNDPLYVIDGVPYISQLLPSLNTTLGSSGGRLVNGYYATYGNPLSLINPADIESIDVLKDADATAIYGSQAANGAILITTKKGKAGEQKIQFNLQQGWGKVTRKMDLLDRRQYLDMRYEALKNDGISLSSLDKTGNFDLTVWDTTLSTDWQKQFIGKTAHYTDLQSTISGGNLSTSFILGAGYHKETVVIPGDFDDQKGSLHFQTNSASSNQKFRLRFVGNYVLDVNRLPNNGDGTDLTNLAMLLPPVAPPLYNSDGTINWALNPAGNSTWDYPGNPAALQLQKYKGRTTNLVSNMLLSYEVIPGLFIKSSFGYTNLQINETATRPAASILPELRQVLPKMGTYANGYINSWIIEPQVNYHTNVGKGQLEALFGSTFQRRYSERQAFTGTGYISDDVLDDIHAASFVQSGPTLRFTYKYSALFGRLNYKLFDRYILNLTARRDGSSRFGSANQFHNFESIGAAWIFSGEKFVKRIFTFLSFGKIKLSYGTTGNDQIGEYQFLSIYNPVSVGNPYQGITALQSVGLKNPYLEWEETRKLSISIDFGFIKDKILFNVNYFQNRSSNQLLSYSLPFTTGFGGVTKNFPATVQNSGWEFSISTTNITTRKIRWLSSINLTIPHNKLLSFPGIENSSYANLLVVGEPITIVKRLHYIGVDPGTGVYYFDSKTNPFNPKIPDDAKVLINPSPTFYGGVQNNMTYKGFQLDFLFQLVKQKGPNYSFGRLPGATRLNQPVYVLERWQQPGDVTSHQRFNSNFSISNAWTNAASNSDGSYSDASYIRLKNISLSWAIPEKLLESIHLNTLRVYTQAQNLMTITNYKGLDPETMSSVSLPPLRVLTVGVQVTL